MTRFVAFACSAVAGGCFNPSAIELTGRDGTTDGDPSLSGGTLSASSTISPTGPTDSFSTTNPTQTSTTETDPFDSTTGDPNGNTETDCPVGTQGCPCDNDACDDTLACVEMVCEDLGALFPLAPGAGDAFGWQNIQTAFEYESGDPCTGRVTLAMGDQAACYVSSDEELKCAGRVFTTTWGPTFVGTGQFNTEQVLIRSTFNSETGNGICALGAGRVRCFGANNGLGVYGNGSTSDVDTWSDWGAFDDVVRIGTGTWDQLCGLDGAGAVHCSGYNYGAFPVEVASSGATSFWVDTFGNHNVDDAQVFRPAQGRTECQIRSSGFVSCAGANYGPSGQVVDGGNVGWPGSGGVAVCWLTADKGVQCSGAGQLTYFEPGRVLAFAHHYYTDSLCAAYDDGSLWCIGSNNQGKLGTGDLADVAVETEVASAGSVRIDCQL